MATSSSAPLPPEGRNDRHPGWFADRLRYWRRFRGLSQEGLGFAAETSTRHLSFLESGRSRPSEEMLFRLMSVLDIPLEERDRILAAEGHPPRFPRDGAVPEAAESTLRLLLDDREQLPVAVLSASSAVLRTNSPACWLFRTFSAEPHLLDQPYDMVALVLDPRFTRSFVVDFEALALRVVKRLHLASLEKPKDPLRKRLLDRALSYPGIRDLWAGRGDSAPPDPATRLRLSRGGIDMCFQTVLTILSEPLQPALVDLFIETYHPIDDATRTILRDKADQPD